MREYLLPFLLPFSLSMPLTIIVRHIAFKKGWVDYPSPRKIHTKPVPRLGGIALFLAFLLTVLFYLIFLSDKLKFVDERVWGVDRNLFGVLLGALILVGAGIYDDIKGLSPFWKFFFQFLAALCVVLFGIRIWWFSNPFGPKIVLGAWSHLFVIFWIVFLVNVVNWLDGLDGLATGVSAISTLTLFFLSLKPEVHQPATALLALILFASALGFLPFNLNPAKIFLGDSGSMFLGYMLAIFAIISGGKVATAFLVLGIPIFDALWVILRRLFQGRPPWLADRRHLHHRFLEAGFSQRQAVFFLYLIAIIFGVAALKLQTWGKLWALLLLFGLMILLAFVLIFLEKRRKVVA